MDITIDGAIHGSWAGGIPRYTASILNALADLELDDITLLSIRDYRVPFLDEILAANVRRLWVPVPDDLPGDPLKRSRVWVEEILPDILSNQAPSVHLAPNYICPTNTRIPTVVMVHDLDFREHPEWFDEETLRYFETLAVPSLLHADRVVVPSRDVGQSLKQQWPNVNATVVPLASNMDKFEPTNVRRRDRSLAHGARYVLNVGGDNVRKNTSRLIFAFQQIRELEAYRDLKLVVVNSSTSRHEDGVIYTREISDDQLAQLYRQAVCFATTSLSEGFGLAAVEAMSLGVPVLAADININHEVLGGAAIYCDPHSTESVFLGLRRVLEGDRLALSQASLERSSLYSWRRTATLTRKLLISAVESSQ